MPRGKNSQTSVYKRSVKIAFLTWTLRGFESQVLHTWRYNRLNSPLDNFLPGSKLKPNQREGLTEMGVC